MILIVAQKALNIYYDGFLAVIMTNKEPIATLMVFFFFNFDLQLNITFYTVYVKSYFTYYACIVTILLLIN